MESFIYFTFAGLPYFKFLKKESQEHRDGEVAHADFARMQREVLENYLIGLIRAVVRPPRLITYTPNLISTVLSPRCSTQQPTV